MTKPTGKNVFALLAPIYDRMMRCCGWFHPDLVDRFFPAVSGWDIADLGGGTGYYGCRLAGKGARVVIVDSAPAMLARIPRAAGEVTALVAPVTATGLAGAGFDAVLLIDVLHHLAEREAVLREAARLLKPGGALLIAEVPLRGGFRCWLRRLIERPICPRHSFVTPETLTEEVQSCGIAVVRLEVSSSNFILQGCKL